MVKNLKLVLLDLDGTLYIGDEPIAGAVEAVARLRRMGLQLRFLTNTTTKSQADLVAQMRAMNFVLDADELISAPVAAKLELQKLARERGRPVRVWPVVADAIKSDFAEFEYDHNHPDFVIMGDIGDSWDLTLINRLFNVLHDGAELIALHKNRFWQTPEGLKADIGFFVSGLEYVCSKQARVMGKPNRDFFQRVLDSAGVAASETIMVGDDLDSDVGGAQLLGMNACLVKTGKYRQAYFNSSTIAPELLLASVAELPAVLV